MEFINYFSHRVFYFFEEISKIPRSSGNEQVISNYIKNFLQERGMDVQQDQNYNLIIRKKATNGSKNSPVVLLQAHLDMVAEKNTGTLHDFKKDAIELHIKNGWIYANNTTLGADDGIGVAMIMAILESTTIQHPALEILFTVSEETGLTGILEFNPTPYNLEAKFLINIDNSEEARVGISCLGGSRTDIIVPFEQQENKYKKIFQISVLGLKGGHSGEEIDKQLGNANKLLLRVLITLSKQVEFSIVEITGGNKENAIPREAQCHIATNVSFEELELIINPLIQIYQAELKYSDAEVFIEVKSLDKGYPKIFSKNATQKILQLLMIHPNGVITRNIIGENTPQTSLNLAVVKTQEHIITISSNVRSSVESEKEWVLEQLKLITGIYSGKFIVRNKYSGWSYNPNSQLALLAKKASTSIFGKEATNMSILGGTEVGVIQGFFNNDLDAISIGPNIEHMHTPDEKVEIESIDRTYRWLIEILKQI